MFAMAGVDEEMFIGGHLCIDGNVEFDLISGPLPHLAAHLFPYSRHFQAVFAKLKAKLSQKLKKENFL